MSWPLGFGICGVANFIALLVLLFSYRFYRLEKPRGSALFDLARVFVASLRKRKSQLSSRVEDYYTGHNGMVPVLTLATPGERLRY